MADIGIVLIEDHDLTRLGLRTALQRQDRIQVVGEAGNAKQGLMLLQDKQPDVAVVDIGLPDMDGIELTRQFKQFQIDTNSFSTRILILTMYDSEESVLAAFGAGANSYCMKDVNIDQLVEAIHATSDGNSWIDPTIANIVLRQMRKPIAVDPTQPKMITIEAVEPAYEEILDNVQLTDRELEILQLIVEGQSNNAIGETLFISLGTVKTHVRNILSKLCADDRTQAAVLALRSGLIS
ncbi:response regulator transcription factor [Phormidium sp. CLA17]|uniref:response regulator n=1 Tax=Leptolyngbya sp. Cla-17 TaxID=2803751 RepID=UPI001490CB5E|nr:response regulator transcription factor [Leptolyngbya sp. Cla-17]MBM0741419.1 response regulator transcription factor [Leptolyngbya sp. Cla-17]